MRPDLRSLSPTIRSRLGEFHGVDLERPIRGFTVQRGGRICEARSTTRIETVDGDTPILRGYASTYDDPYELGPQDDWGWVEIIGRGAGAKSIAERDDVYLFFDHDGLPLASTKDGTLRLSENERGLFSDADIDSGSSYSMEVYRRVQRGQLDRMSFAFQVLRERWEDEDGNEMDARIAPVRRIQEVKLYDTSVVSFPANPNTTVQANADIMSLAEAKSLLSTGMSLAEARTALAI